MKKLFALALVIVMVLSMATTAFAADPTYTVTINGHAPNHVYEAYQIFSGTLDSTGLILAEPINWGSGIDGVEFVKFLNSPQTTLDKIFADSGKDNVFAGVATASDVVNILRGYADKDQMVDIFAKYAGNYLKTPSGTLTVTGTTYKIAGLEAGYYLIRDSKVSPPPSENDFSTKFILEVVGNVEVTPKGSVPIVNKTVSNEENGVYSEMVNSTVGTPVWFELNATLPSNFEIYDTYKMQFVDTLSSGLTFTDGSVKAYVQRSGGVLEEIPATCYDVHYPSSIIGVTFDVEFGNLKDSDFPALLLENKIVVRYQATLNENAVIGNAGNPNIVDLIYSNDPYSNSEGETGPDDAIVFTFGLDVDKYDKADPTKKLNGAEFVLYRRQIVNVGGTDTLTLHFAVVENGIFKEWIPVTDIPIGSSTAENWEKAKIALDENLPKVTLTTETISGKEGQISIKGLEPHIYHILEIKAPDGYNLPKDPFKITIEPTYDSTGKYTGMRYEYGSTALTEKENGHIEIGIANGQGTTLPSTGGMGTTLFYVIGGIMVLAAVTLLITKKRMIAA